MNNKIYISCFLILSLILFKSCKKDNFIAKEDTQFKTVPYNLEVKPWYPQLKLPTDNPLTEEGVLLGRMLFYDPIISGDSTLSCSGCHRLSLAFADSRRFSVGITGQVGTRTSMPLFNLMWSNKFFWDGRAKTLKEQILLPIAAHDEMNLNIYDAVQKLKNSPLYLNHIKKAFNTTNVEPIHIQKSIEQFLVTILSFNAPIDKLWGRTDTLNVISASALRGLNIFMTPIESGGADCFHCHSNIPFLGNTSASSVMSNNGLSSVHHDKGFGNITGRIEDEGKFKIPSLRNIAATAPYMHDGRFATLEDVIDFYSTKIKLDSPNLDINILSHGKQLNLTSQQKEDLVEFLKTLTDTEYLNNSKYKTPF